jgi:hypothetical protein
MPPKVAFAPWGDAIYGSDNVRRVAQKLRDEQIPISVIWTEDWKGAFQDGDNYTLEEEWEVDPEVYPDLPTLASDLHALGFHFHVYFNPFVYEGTKAWSETADNGWLVSRADGTPYTFTGAKFDPTSVLDVDHPDARAWAIDKMRAAIAQGADGWMHDFAEWLPADAITYAGWATTATTPTPSGGKSWRARPSTGRPTRPPRAAPSSCARAGSARPRSPTWCGRAISARASTPTTACPPSCPSASAWAWWASRPTGTTWRATSRAPTPAPPKSCGSAGPRSARGRPSCAPTTARSPAATGTGERDEATIAHWKRMCELHMALVPYMEGLALRASQTGLPIWRGLALDAPSDPVAWTIIDEVFVGDHVLVAPVSVPGATSRDVYLPSGLYYPWDSGGPVVTGPATGTRSPRPLTEIPVFAAEPARWCPPIHRRRDDAGQRLARGARRTPPWATIAWCACSSARPAAFTEAGGLTYELSHAGEAEGPAAEVVSAVTWGGVELPLCADDDEHDCVTLEGGLTEARVTGPGTLAFMGAGGELATLVVGGGDLARRLFVRARHG